MSKYLTVDMMRKIAAEYDKGRLLLISTTQFDAAKPVTWNIGATAKTASPEALETRWEVRTGTITQTQQQGGQGRAER